MSGLNEVRIRQARKALTFINQHPYATSQEIARGVDEIKTMGMWAAVRPFAYDIASVVYKGRALANVRVGSLSCWSVESSVDALVLHAVERLRQATTRDRNLSDWGGIDLLSTSDDLMARMVAKAVQDKAASSAGITSVLEALDAVILDRREAVRDEAFTARLKWVTA